MTWVQSAAGAQFSWAGVTSRPGDTRRPGDEENCGRKHGDRSHTVSLAKLSDAPRESVRRGPSSSGPRQRQATVQEELPGGAQLRVSASMAATTSASRARAKARGLLIRTAH